MYRTPKLWSSKLDRGLVPDVGVAEVTYQSPHLFFTSSFPAYSARWQPVTGNVTQCCSFLPSVKGEGKPVLSAKECAFPGVALIIQTTCLVVDFEEISSDSPPCLHIVHFHWYFPSCPLFSSPLFPPHFLPFFPFPPLFPFFLTFSPSFYLLFFFLSFSFSSLFFPPPFLFPFFLPPYSFSFLFFFPCFSPFLLP